MATNLPKFTNVTAPRTRTNWEADAEVAIDAAIAAAVAAHKTEIKNEIKAIVASAATYAEFQTDVAAWTPSP